jgi:hypothetical protein
VSCLTPLILESSLASQLVDVPLLRVLIGTFGIAYL